MRRSTMRSAAPAYDSSAGSRRRPPYDPEIAAALAVAEPGEQELLNGDLAAWRDRYQTQRSDVDAATAAGLISRDDFEIVRPDGSPVVLSILRDPSLPDPRPGVFHVHGGGLMAGDRFSEGDWLVDTVLRFGLTVATVEYRLAPEHPYPASVEDCYLGLTWLRDHTTALGVDPARLIICGVSAGGGLAAATALLARDRGDVGLAGQLLIAPMLDDRDNSVSTHQFEDGPWPRRANVLAWRALLGPAYGSPDLPGPAAPSRALDFSGLPSAYLEVGSAEVLRDEAVAYASALWSAGTQAELHVWAGGTHGFDVLAHTALTHAAVAARQSWLERVLDVVGRNWSVPDRVSDA